MRLFAFELTLPSDGYRGTQALLTSTGYLLLSVRGRVLRFTVGDGIGQIIKSLEALAVPQDDQPSLHHTVTKAKTE